MKNVFFIYISIENFPSPRRYVRSKVSLQKMPTWPRSPLPIDLLNVVCSFIGDKYHYLVCDSLTPLGNLSHSRLFMQSRKHAWTRIGNLCNRRSRKFYYNYEMVYPTLYVKYGYVIIGEDIPVFENRLDRLKSRLDFAIPGPQERGMQQYIKNEIRNELAKKYARNIGHISLAENIRQFCLPVK